HYSRFDAGQGLDAWLKAAGTPVLQQVDTRALTVRVRDAGVMRAAIIPDTLADTYGLDDLLAAPEMAGADLARAVSTPTPYDYGVSDDDGRPRVAVLDFGLKREMLRLLDAEGLRIRVFPADT